MNLPYFFRYKTEIFFPLLNNLKNLGQSYITDLDLWDGNGNIAIFHRTDLVICSHSREEKTPSYSQIITVDFWNALL